MNSAFNENSLQKMNNIISNKYKKGNRVNFNKSYNSINENNKKTSKANSKSLPRIVRLEISFDKILKNSKIEFSNDKSLVEKLFQIKDGLKIKKKTFI